MLNYINALFIVSIATRLVDNKQFKKYITLHHIVKVYKSIKETNNIRKKNMKFIRNK